MPITPEVLDQILKDYEKPEELLSENGLLQQLTKALVERALNGEMTHHLDYKKHYSRRLKSVCCAPSQVPVKIQRSVGLQ
ncbi:MAG: hypothetical protein M3033_01715 [Acidobacteriota bacterium]|nr:hypothetical protein [Acidobacteriota bacterium]